MISIHSTYLCVLYNTLYKYIVKQPYITIYCGNGIRYKIKRVQNKKNQAYFPAGNDKKKLNVRKHLICLEEIKTQALKQYYNNRFLARILQLYLLVLDHESFCCVKDFKWFFWKHQVGFIKIQFRNICDTSLQRCGSL